MKQVIFLFFAFGIPLVMTGQTNYQPLADRFMAFYNEEQSDSIFNMYSDIVKEKLPQDKNKTVMEGLHIQFGDLKSLKVMRQDTGYARYKAIFKDQTLTLVLAVDRQGLIEGLRFIPYTPEQTEEQKKNSPSNLSIQSGAGRVYGTLKVPELTVTMPVVLIIAGSGPTDRNGNQAGGLNTNAYSMLADSLYKRGIATLRYDKRGIGESSGAMKSESDIVFEDGIQDALAFVRLLKSDKRFSKLIVLGHSEGSLVGMLASAAASADGFISVAGAGEKIDLIIERQLQSQSPVLASKAKIILDSLKQGKSVSDPGAGLQSLFRPSIQPYLISWLQLDPAVEIRKLKIPVLIIQGTKDLQVTEKDAQKLKAAYPAARLVIIPQMNHVLKEAGTNAESNRATYNNPDLPLKAELVKSVSEFVFAIK